MELTDDLKKYATDEELKLFESNGNDLNELLRDLVMVIEDFYEIHNTDNDYLRRKNITINDLIDNIKDYYYKS